MPSNYLSQQSGITPLLAVQALGRQIQNRWIWKNLQFDLYPGENLAITGASGSGKSLLLRSLANLDPIQEGQLWFQGKVLSSYAEPYYRSQVIYLHQRPALIEGSVEDNLRQVYRFNIHRHQSFDRDQILAYLAALGRDNSFLTRPSSALSGGEAQIVAFIRALQLSPQVLLLDEPTASLDLETVYALETLVQYWQKADPNRATVWTSHTLEQIHRVTQRQFNLQSL
ncbi:MAG: ATP-binding cassette domain-containing protein [Leptolyngbya sp. DLM2.Bin15]|nr:MAG: ATP-binding cassette domain-containing protein [Leptolyngbya sp. DLM2.Bin15]